MKLPQSRASLHRFAPARGTDPLRVASLGTSCAAAIVAAWALTWPAPAVRDDVASAAKTATTPTPSDAPRGQPQIRVPDLMGRPLFRRDRKPGLPPPPPPDPREQQKEIEAATNRRDVLNQYQLSGTVLSAGHRIAILARVGDPKMLLVREGDDLEGWEVAEIARRAVKLKSGDEVAELAFPKPQSPAGPQVTAAIPAR